MCSILGKTSDKETGMPQASQSYANHRKFVPWWHFFAPLVLLVNLVWALWKLGRAFTSDATPVTFDGVLAVLMAVALIVVWFYSRIFPLAVQDRVIRLEMRLRLARVLPDDLKGRIDELGRGHIIALRFASDAELPDLTRKALDEGADRETIKKQIKDWQADDWRC
jgi:hypothetical protein